MYIKRKNNISIYSNIHTITFVTVVIVLLGAWKLDNVGLNEEIILTVLWMVLVTFDFGSGGFASIKLGNLGLKTAEYILKKTLVMPKSVREEIGFKQNKKYIALKKAEITKIKEKIEPSLAMSYTFIIATGVVAGITSLGFAMSKA